MTHLGHNTIAKLERDEIKVVQPWVLSRILPVLAKRSKEAFPDVQEDIYSYLLQR